MIQARIGSKIKERRNELELSQEQLAFTAGVTPAYLGQVRRGEQHLLHLLAELNEEQKQEIVRITEMILNAIE